MLNTGNILFSIEFFSKSIETHFWLIKHHVINLKKNAKFINLRVLVITYIFIIDTVECTRISFVNIFHILVYQRNKINKSQ